MKAQVKLPPKLIPVFTGQARYRGAYGGRGSAKSFNFAKMTAVRGYIHGMAGNTGNILCGREFMNSLDESSFEEVKKAIYSEPFLETYFDVGEKYIRSKDKRINYRFTGLRHNIDSVKSKSNIFIAWIDEAEAVSEKAWSKFIPTIRDSGSEIWVSWNPEEKASATDVRFRKNPPENSKIVQLNWRDNPWFENTELPQERDHDKKILTNALYDWIWEGAYLEASEESIIKPEFFGRYSDIPKLARSVIIVDTANKAKEHNDWTVFLYVGVGYDGNIYLLDLFRDKMESVERETSLIDFFNKHKKTITNPSGASEIYIEDIGTGTDLIQRLKRKNFPAKSIIRKRNNSSFNAKCARLMDVISEIGSGILFLPEKANSITDAKWVSDFIKECKEFMPDDSHDHDDQVDVLIDAVAHFKKNKRLYAV